MPTACFIVNLAHPITAAVPMTSASPYIPGHYLLQLMDTGLLPAAVTERLQQHLIKTGLDPLQLSEARLSPQSLEALLHAWPDVRPQRLAIEFGQKITLTSQGNLSLLSMTAPTLRDALELYAFLPLLTNAVSLQFYITGQGGHIQILPHSGAPLIDQLHCDGVISSIVFPPSALDIPCQYADSLTHHRLVKHSQERLSGQQQAVPLVSQIRQLLAAESIAPNQQSVACALNMSRSTLKRRLTREHTHFQAVLTHFRKENAVRLLLGTTLSLEQIAEKLGYSDQTNFSHAFRQWSGMTPGQFRKHSR